MQIDDLIKILKIQQWQKLKGDLRVFEELSGSSYSHRECGSYLKISKLIDVFIEAIENDDLDRDL